MMPVYFLKNFSAVKGSPRDSAHNYPQYEGPEKPPVEGRGRWKVPGHGVEGLRREGSKRRTAVALRLYHSRVKMGESARAL